MKNVKRGPMGVMEVNVLVVLLIHPVHQIVIFLIAALIVMGDIMTFHQILVSTHVLFKFWRGQTIKA